MYKRHIVWTGDLDESAEYAPVIVHDDYTEWHRVDNPVAGMRFYNVDHAARFGLVQLPLLKTEETR